MERDITIERGLSEPVAIGAPEPVALDAPRRARGRAARHTAATTSASEAEAA